MNALTQKMLTEAGWYPGRQIDTEPIAAALRDAGYAVLPWQLRFLSEFGGLSLQAGSKLSGQVHITFDVILALKESFGTADREEGSLDSLCSPDEATSIIGRSMDSGGVDMILITESGRISVREETGEIFMGESPDEAMDNFCSEGWLYYMNDGNVHRHWRSRKIGLEYGARDVFVFENLAPMEHYTNPDQRILDPDKRS